MATVEKTLSSRDSNQLKSNGSDLNLPDDFYPLCWQDDERMENLFAAFRDKSVNPVNYDTKMKFWKNLIQEYCSVQGNSTVSISELRTAFERKGKKPYCLDTVLDELLSEGLAKSKSQFMEPPLLTWPGWAVHKLVKAPLRWSYYKVKESVISNAANGNCNDNTEYILIEVAKVRSILYSFAFS